MRGEGSRRHSLRGRRPLARPAWIAAHRGEDVEAAARVLAGRDPEVLAVHQQRVRPTLGQLAGAHQSSEHIHPVGHDLAITRGVTPPPLPPSVHRHQGKPRRPASGSLGRSAIAGALRDLDQRLADLARSKPIVPRARLTLPRLQRRRALHTERVRLPLARQHRREPMRPITGRSTQPPLTTMRRLPIPTSPHHDRTSVTTHRTLGNLHRYPTLPTATDISILVE